METELEKPNIVVPFGFQADLSICTIRLNADEILELEIILRHAYNKSADLVVRERIENLYKKILRILTQWTVNESD